MIHSMTAFARAQNQIGSTIICWEIKSVNHRYLEANFRLPESFRSLEPACRSALRDLVSRGKLDCQLKLDYAPNAAQTIIINEDMVNALLSTGEQLALKNSLANDLTVSQVLSWPGVVQLAQPDEDSMGQEIVQLFETALKQLISNRQAEGQKLKTFISERLKALGEEVAKARLLINRISRLAREKLMSRLDSLQLTVTDNRIEQEIAMMLARLDVSEEMDRLKVHIDEVAKVLEKDLAVGRRLDFLMQELNREANTLSSKSDSAELTRLAVEMKVLIEQMREQIQNIE